MKDFKKVGIIVSLLAIVTGMSSCSKPIDLSEMIDQCTVNLGGEMLYLDDSSKEPKCKLKFNGKMVEFGQSQVTSAFYKQISDRNFELKQKLADQGINAEETSVGDGIGAAALGIGGSILGGKVLNSILR